MNILTPAMLMRPFDPDNRDAVLAALMSPVSNDPIYEAVNTCLRELATQLADACRQVKGPVVLRIRYPRTALEEISVDLFRDFLENSPSAPCVVIFWYGAH